MFKFNFNADSEADAKEEELNEEFSTEPSVEITPNEKLKDFVDSGMDCDTYQCGNICIKHILPKTVLDYLSSHNIKSSIVTAETSHSDLLAGVYEGGLKVWECTFDLLNYLQSQNVSFTGKKVLDLGCGVGLLGIFALLKEASLVCFQDYNREVLEYTTMPNVLINDCKSGVPKYFCGDWNSFAGLCEETFDFILTSETIYNTKNYNKLLNIFKKCTKKDCVIYVAAKCYYFGVGGGIQQFQNDIESEGIFSVTTAWKCEEGIKRQILKITRL